MIRRRELLKTPLLAAACADLSAQSAPDRLNQGPFDIDQDDGWATIATTLPAEGAIRNPGLGLVGYTWEESGPAVDVRSGKETLERAVEKLAALPFVDILYIRCDWRDVQSAPGRLDLNPVWKLTLDAARRHGLRFAFRVQMSSPNFQPTRLALPDFVRDRVPLVEISPRYREPRYDHPAFQSAFRELNELLAREFDSNPLVEWVDLMQYGFWGEGHTSNLPNPFPDYATALRTFEAMTRFQLDTWKHAPLAVNTQPDISKVGNREIIDMAIRAGCWLRSDSVIVEEPIQIEMLRNRPQYLAAILEDGYHRHYKPEESQALTDTMQHAIDLGANYWSLWTEAENLSHYATALARVRSQLGYRVRPSWIWQRKRYGGSELILGVKNDGLAGVPGILRIHLESTDGRVKLSGSLDPGHPHAGMVRQCAFILSKELDGQKVKLTAELEIRGRSRPMEWACTERPLTVQLKSLNDKDWRKNV
jgi:hypothetical protein